MDGNRRYAGKNNVKKSATIQKVSKTFQDVHNGAVYWESENSLYIQYWDFQV